MLVLKLVPEILTYMKFLKTIKTKFLLSQNKYDKKSIKDGTKIYQESPLTDRTKRILDNSNKIIRGINLFISMIDMMSLKFLKNIMLDQIIMLI